MFFAKPWLNSSYEIVNISKGQAQLDSISLKFTPANWGIVSLNILNLPFYTMCCSKLIILVSIQHKLRTPTENYSCYLNTDHSDSYALFPKAFIFSADSAHSVGRVKYLSIVELGISFAGYWVETESTVLLRMF